MRHILRTLLSKRTKHSVAATTTSELVVESLEDRMMLSTVSVFAMGETGDELINIQVDGQGTIAAIGAFPTDGFQEFQFYVDGPVSADDIRIEFVNDVYDPSTGFDRNVFVDRIEVDGNIYQTENAAVFSTGTWRPSDGLLPGFGRGEVLQANGYLQYSDDGFGGVANTTYIEAELEITDFTNQIDVDVLIDDRVVDSWSLESPDSTGVFGYRVQGDISPDRIKLAFTNDDYAMNPDGSVALDNNAQFNYVNIDGVNYDPHSQNVFSTGTWRPAEGVTPGFGLGNVLHANGYLQFFDTPTTDGTQIVIDARGFGDLVDFELQIDEITVASYSFTASTGYTQDVLAFNAVGDIDSERVRVVFTNDAMFTDPITGASIDRNLQINSVSIGGVVFDPDNANVYSTGTWRSVDGMTPGFGRGDFLHANGYLQFFSNPPVSTQVIYENDFDQHSAGFYTEQQLNNDWNTPEFNDGIDEGRVSIVTGSDAYGGGSSLAVAYPEDEVGTKETGAQWQLELDGEYEEAYLSYRVKFADGFDFVRGGKLPGLAGGTAPTGTAPAEGDNGWTARMMWLSDFDGEPGNPEQLVTQAISYAKYTDSGFDQDGKDEDKINWIDADGTRTEFNSGVWYEITQRVKMNTPGVSDGVIQVWLDGQLVHDQTDVLFRTVSDLKIDQVYFSTFFGGGSGWETTKDETVFFDDFEVSIPQNVG